MGTTADKLNKILETKQAIKQAIIDKGGDIDDKTVFADYPSKINAIQTGDSESVWNLITNNGTRGQYLFYSCKMTELDINFLNTSNITNMSYMFNGCNNLTSLDLSNWDTSNVTDIRQMFAYCSKLTSLDLSNFDTSNVKDMSSMFAQCNNLTSLDLSNWDTSQVTNMSYMFYYCNNLKSIDVSGFDTSNVTDMTFVFATCRALTSLDCSNWDISKVTANYNLNTAFNYCNNLVDFKAPKNISAPMNVSDSTALSHDSLMSIINNLIAVTSTKKLTLGATNKAKLTAEELAIATNKGWTIA